MNVVDPILFQAKLNPAAAAICVPGTKLNVVSYARLARFIHNVSRTAVAHGLSKGNIVAIAVTDTITHAALILGLTRLGVVTMSITQPAIPVGLLVDAVLSDDAAPIAGAKKVVRVDKFLARRRRHPDGRQGCLLPGRRKPVPAVSDIGFYRRFQGHPANPTHASASDCAA